jgi:predicted transglutaminase-like cysteine proteinase
LRKILLIAAAAAVLSGCSLSAGRTPPAITGSGSTEVAFDPACWPERCDVGRRWMPVAGPAVLVPKAFHAFCERERRLCDTVSGENTVRLTAALARDLAGVNTAVNRRIRQREDIETTGRADDWRVPETEGDCEDFAILKKRELLDRGWPAAALLITVARLPGTGEGHTVLAVRTSAGDLILDNLADGVRLWSDTPYRYFARQSSDKFGRWDRIGA